MGSAKGERQSPKRSLGKPKQAPTLARKPSVRTAIQAQADAMAKDLTQPETFQLATHTNDKKPVNCCPCEGATTNAKYV